MIRLHQRRRIRRRNAWLGTWATAVVLLAIGWGSQQVAFQAQARLSKQVGALQSQRAEVRRRMTLAASRHAALLNRLQTIAEAHRPQPWPRRLLTLTQIAPPGVFLSALRLTVPKLDPGLEKSRGLLPAREAGDKPAPAARTDRGSSEPNAPAEPNASSIRLQGHALDYGALSQFLGGLQNLPGWHHVELVRATQTPYGDGLMIAFELDCRVLEDGP